jgi:hypothetical protein
MVAKMEYDVHTDTWIMGGEGATPTPPADAWTRAVTQTAATMDAEPYKPRLQAAMDLVLAGAVDDAPFGAVVQSGSHRYTIDEETGCPCQDAQHRSRWCKHATAVELYRRARAHLHADTPTPTQEVVPMAETPQPTPRPTPPARCTLKWQHDGIEYLYTVEGDTNAEVFAMLKEVKEAVAKVRACQSKAETTPPQGQIPAGPAPCPEHGSAKMKRSKFKGWYCSGRLESGEFCKYEVKD